MYEERGPPYSSTNPGRAHTTASKVETNARMCTRPLSGPVGLMANAHTYSETHTFAGNSPRRIAVLDGRGYDSDMARRHTHPCAFPIEIRQTAAPSHAPEGPYTASAATAVGRSNSPIMPGPWPRICLAAGEHDMRSEICFGIQPQWCTSTWGCHVSNASHL